MLCSPYMSGYMQVEVMAATVGGHISMVSPPFDAMRNDCLLFDYKVWMAEYSSDHAPPPRLDVYLSAADHVYSGLIIWNSNGTGEGHVQLPISASPGAVLYRVSFVGVVGDPGTTLIQVANVQLEEHSCRAAACEGTGCAGDYGCPSLSTFCKFVGLCWVTSNSCSTWSDLNSVWLRMIVLFNFRCRLPFRIE